MSPGTRSLQEAEADQGEGDPLAFCLSSSTHVAMPVPLLPGYAEAVGRGCQDALRMRRPEMKPR